MIEENPLEKGKSPSVQVCYDKLCATFKGFPAWAVYALVGLLLFLAVLAFVGKRAEAKTPY